MKTFFFIFFWCSLPPALLAQQDNDNILSLQDDLLDRLTGTWNVSSVAHGFVSTAEVKGKWTFHHQHFYLHFQGKEIVPWLHVPMEFAYYIGYKHSTEQYVVHQMSVFGDDDYEGFCYGKRNGNEITFWQKNAPNSDTTIVQRLTWQPGSGQWHINSRPEIKGKMGDVFLDMTLTAVAPSLKKSRATAK